MNSHHQGGCHNKQQTQACTSQISGQSKQADQAAANTRGQRGTVGENRLALEPQLLEVWHRIHPVERITHLIKTTQGKLQQSTGCLGKFLQQQGEFIDKRRHQHRRQRGEQQSKGTDTNQKCQRAPHRETPLQRFHQAAERKSHHDGCKQQQQPLTQGPQDETRSDQRCEGQCLGKIQASALASPSV